MAIPNTPRTGGMISGVVGEFAFDGPNRTKTEVRKDVKADAGLPGRAFTYNADGTVTIGGAGVFAGVLVGGHTLANGALGTGNAGALCQMGELYVNLRRKTGSAAPAIGGKVYFDTATGQIWSSTQDEGAVANTEIKGATISVNVPQASGSVTNTIAVVSFTGPQPT